MGWILAAPIRRHGLVQFAHFVRGSFNLGAEPQVGEAQRLKTGSEVVDQILLGDLITRERGAVGGFIRILRFHLLQQLRDLFA